MKFTPTIDKNVYFDMSDLQKFEFRSSLFKKYRELRNEYSVSLAKRKLQLEFGVSYKLLKFDEINRLFKEIENI